MSRELNPSMLEKRIYDLEKNGGGGGGEIEHLTEVIESVDNSLITEVDGVQTHFYLDYKDGKFGMNTDEGRGADTFHPFNAGGLEYDFAFLCKSHSSAISELNYYEKTVGFVESMSYNDTDKFIDNEYFKQEYSNYNWKITLKQPMIVNDSYENAGAVLGWKFDVNASMILKKIND